VLKTILGYLIVSLAAVAALLALLLIGARLLLMVSPILVLIVLSGALFYIGQWLLGKKS